MRCPNCGTALDANRLDGLCPACTWKALSLLQDARAESTPKAARDAGLFSVPNHIVLEEIARGGMGIVYRAQQQDPARLVALKMLLPHQSGSAQMLDRFRLEVRALTELEHPAILPVYQMGQYEGMPYFTMKLATGGTLASRVEAFNGKFREIGQLMLTLVQAVRFAHERGVLHRDLKPGNILFDESNRPYVSDFGLAKLADGTLETDGSVRTGSGLMLGTPEFLSPEVLSGGAAAATTATDIYGLGAVLYQLLCGRPPYAAEQLPRLLRQISEQEPARPSTLRPGVPRDLEVICLKCLARLPSQRYRTAQELEEDLKRWLAHRPILARPVALWERVGQWVRNNPALTALSVLLAISLAIGGALLARANQRLRTALSQTETAYSAARQNLHSALLGQSRLLLESGDSGQRGRLLALLKQTAALNPSLEVRNQAVAALALPDVETVGASERGSVRASSDDLKRSDAPRSDASRSAAAAPVFFRFPAPDDYHACTLDISRNGRLLLTGTMQSVALWDTITRTQIWSRSQFALPWMYVAFPPDGKSLLYSARNFGIQRSEYSCVEREVASLNSSKNQNQSLVTVHVNDPATVGSAQEATILGFTGRGADWLVAAERTGFYISRVEIWPGGDPGQARAVAQGERITFFALSPDEAWGASTTVPGTDVCLWDAKQVRIIGHLGQTNAIIAEFTPDSHWLIARMPDHYGLWEVPAASESAKGDQPLAEKKEPHWRLVKQWPVTFGGWMGSRIAFSRNGRWVAAPWGGSRFQLLDARDFSELCVFKAPLGFEAISAVWSRDDSKLYLLDSGHRLYEWDIAALRGALRELGLDWKD
ncbi:MAG: hypothetical protein C5B50_29870 [Verrucomicrobia bacterium]|nr:MAG: hypothetical protein C5B50_29870 [Verrucomicrobiota bacterium]